METPRETIADMLVEFPAVFRQVGIVRCARDGDAGIETDDVHAAKLVLQGEAKSLAETSGVCIFFDIDGAFRRPSVSGARMERRSVGVAERLACAFCNDVGIVRERPLDARAKFVCRRRLVLEGDCRMEHVGAIDRRELCRVFRPCGAKRDTVDICCHLGNASCSGCSGFKREPAA